MQLHVGHCQCVAHRRDTMKGRAGRHPCWHVACCACAVRLPRRKQSHSVVISVEGAAPSVLLHAGLHCCHSRWRWAMARLRRCCLARPTASTWTGQHCGARWVVLLDCAPGFVAGAGQSQRRREQAREAGWGHCEELRSRDMPPSGEERECAQLARAMCAEVPVMPSPADAAAGGALGRLPGRPPGGSLPQVWGAGADGGAQPGSHCRCQHSWQPPRHSEQLGGAATGGSQGSGRASSRGC